MTLKLLSDSPKFQVLRLLEPGRFNARAPKLAWRPQDVPSQATFNKQLDHKRFRDRKPPNSRSRQRADAAEGHPRSGHKAALSDFSVMAKVHLQNERFRRLVMAACRLSSVSV